MHPIIAQQLHERRKFLTSSASGLGTAALATLLAGDGLLAVEPSSDNPLAPRAPHFAPKAKNCIFIFLAGGTSQIELFDPKPALNKLDGQQIPQAFREGIRLGQTRWDAPLMGSRTGFRKYGECGMELSELLPQIGSVADEIALVRSMHHEAFDHAPGELEIVTGKDLPGRPSIGAWLTYGLGSESANLPGYVVMINHRGPKARALTWGSGFLPAMHQGMLLRNEGQPILNLRTPQGVSPELHRAQLDAIAELNALKQQSTGDEQIAARIASYELAFRMQTAAPELVDLADESPATLKAYGVERGGEEGSFSRNLLLARRLVERGVRYVTLMQANWDHHDRLAADLPLRCREVDQPIAALIRDLKQRGLLDSTLVVWGTEFGRTAITQGEWNAAGRDHHPHAFSLWLAGGGVRGGQVLGATDELAWRVTENPVHTNDFHATLLYLFGLDHKRLTYRFQGLDLRLTDVGGHIVKQLLA
jgi:hypothetical protein